MKKLIWSALLLTPFLAMAEQPSDTDDSPVQITGSLRSPSISLPEAYSTMHPSDYYDYLRTYDLANGMELTVYGYRNRVYAAVGDQPRHELVAAGPSTFYARDGAMKMSVELLGQYEAQGELQMVVPAVALGGEATGKNVLLRIAIH
ncbi:hypothetical protein [Chitinimonas sp.]|uniref:hypothetical protein n=1 Tax=Chitinimonas sp. TaxID=1934313 RepID=UPI002F925904